MSKGNVDAFLKALFQREAGKNTKVINYAGYIGKYQFGESALIDLGYYQADGTSENDWSGNWSGKHGIASRGAFLDSEAAQDVAAREWIALLCKRMKKMKLDAFIGKTIKGIKITESGIIAGAHLKGFGNVKHPGVAQFLRTGGDTDAGDGLGTKVSHYVGLLADYELGCCNKLSVVFAEKKTGSPIPGMQVQVKKNGKPHTTVKTNEHGFLPDLHGFSAGDQYEILVAKVSGGFKSLKTGFMKDVDATLAFLSPKAATTTTTQVHKGEPMARKPSTPPPSKPAMKAAAPNHSVVAETAKQTPVAQPRQQTEQQLAPLSKPESVTPIHPLAPALQVQPSPLPDHVDAVAPAAQPEQTSITPIEADALDRDSALWDRLGELTPGEPVPPDDAALPAGVPAVPIGSMSGTAKAAPVLPNILPPVAATPPPVASVPAPQQAPVPTPTPKKPPAPVVKAKAEQTRSESGHPKAVAKKAPPPLPPKPPATKVQKTIAGLLFPLEKKPKESYHDGARRFGSNRSKGTRKHAGIDLYAPVGTLVRAMADGVVLQVYEFYAKTFVIEIDHGTFIARYGEVSPKGILVDARDEVTRGQALAKVGQLAGLNMSMLHLEMYGSTESPLAKGKGLTQKGKPPFQRRDDLINPTDSIDQAVME